MIRLLRRCVTNHRTTQILKLASMSSPVKTIHQTPPISVLHDDRGRNVLAGYWRRVGTTSRDHVVRNQVAQNDDDGASYRIHPIVVRAIPRCTLIDEMVTIKLRGLQSNQDVTLRSYFDDEGKQFDSYAHYTSDDDGGVDTTTLPSTGGMFTGVQPMGLFWSMQSCSGPSKRHLKRDVTKPLTVHITAHNGHLDGDKLREESLPIASTSVERRYMSDNVELMKVRTGGIQGTLLKPKGPGPFPAVINMLGMASGYIATRSALLANKGYASLTLSYFGGDGQPGYNEVKALEMEYFEEAVDWLSSQPFVQPDGVATFGLCKGGEMALAMAIHFPEKIRAAIAINSYGGFSLWPTTYKGEMYPVAEGTKPTVVDARFRCNAENVPRDAHGHSLLMDFYDSVESTKYQKFENIRCPTLLICSEQDALVNYRFSHKMAEKINNNGMDNKCDLITYPGAGHTIELPHSSICTDTYMASWGIVALGGVPVHIEAAQVDAWKEIFAFLDENMEVIRREVNQSC